MELHHAQLFKLHPGMTMEDVGAALASADPTALFGVGVPDGGTGAVDPGSTSTADAVVELSEGIYAFLCFIEDSNGVPHLAQGMVASFDVTSAQQQRALPASDLDVELLDYSFEVVDDLAAGSTLNVVNSSEVEPHELNLLALAPGADMNDVFELLASEEPPDGPLPFTFVGGVNAIAPGASQLLVLDLDPGCFVLACFIPSFDPANEGRIHAELGMVRQINVR
jgi:hypothetical protein